MERGMSSHDTVAVLGTGIMGAPMARNLLGAGFPLVVLDPQGALARRRASFGHASRRPGRPAHVLREREQ